MVKQNKMYRSLKRKTSSKSQKKQKKHRRKQKGGQAPSCLTSVDTSKYMNSCKNANLHNRIDTMNYDLIEGNGAMPAGQLGGARCTETAMEKGPLSFTQVLNESEKLIGGNASNFDTTTLETDVAAADGFPQAQMGGSGFSIIPEEIIGGLPGRAKYDSCCQPVIAGGKLVQGAGSEAMCGHQMGGSKKKRSARKCKGRRKGKGRRKSLKKNMKGGAPGKYPFKGETSNYDDNAMGKDFAGKQPYWSPETR
jgi:hypothetical protein